MTFDDLQDVAGHAGTKRDFESANGDDEDEEEEEEEEEEKKKKEKDEEDEEDEEGEDHDDGANQRLSRQAGKIVTGGLRLCVPHPFPDRSGDSRPGRHSH